jgi:8-oxo-dGTP pyrophosphatase MutT (NUDIX family)
MKVQEYSIGFMFTEAMTQVLLILKNHGPKCVVGRWNGIGGHIEPGKIHVAEQDDVFGKPNCTCGCQEAETPIQCQIREFFEETGVQTTEDDWSKFTELRGEDFVVHCFWGRNNRAVLNARTMTDEKVEIWNHPEALNIPLAPNLKWMLPFLMDESTKNHLCVVLADYKKDDEL